MCGIVGMVCKSPSGFFNQDKDIFKEMLFADTLRGSDATGAFAVNRHGNIRGVKQALAAPWFIGSKKYKEFEDKILNDVMLIGHNRKATHGDKQNDNHAHPFLYDPIVLVHNGVVGNHADLVEKDEASSVDSETIAKSLVSNGVEETLRNITGSYALVWYNINEKVLYMIRNYARPLSIVDTDVNWYIASEAGIPFWISSRKSQKVKGVKELKPGTLYSINLESLKTIEEKELDLTKKSLPVTVPATTTVTNPQTPKTNYTTGTTESSTNLEKDFEDLESLFYSEEDYKSFGVINLLRTGDRVLLEVDRYAPSTGPALTNHGKFVCIGKVANTGGTDYPVYVRWFSNSSPVVGAIMGGAVKTIYSRDKTISNGGPLIDLEEVFPQRTMKTKNGYHLTKRMFNSPFVHKTCNTCNSDIYVKDLQTSVIEMNTSNNTYEVVCPTCAAEL